jgi:hypothetical protein
MDAGTPPPGSGSEDHGKQLSRLVCPLCGRALEFTGPRPLFCGFCGKPLPKSTADGSTLETTVVPAAIGPEAPTLPTFSPLYTPPAEQPQVVGGYRLLRRLGGGGMGTVHEAEDSAGRRVALKLIAGNQPGSDDTLERFRREGRLASALSHPRCVFVLAADEDAGRPYIVMELMPGQTLADTLRERGPLSPGEAVAKIMDVLDGLREAHRLGVVHRDIKPSNCFVDADGRIKLGDFGLSKSLVGDIRLTQSGAFLGTPLFSSPEQVRGEPLGPQSDLYSLAATLYTLLTGKAPFEGGDAAATLARIAADPAPSMRTLRPEVPPALDRAVLKGLERDRRKRWRDLEEFKEALAPFMPGRQDAAGRGVRFAAFLVDVVLLKVLGFFWVVLLMATGRLSLERSQEFPGYEAVRQIVATTVIWFLYFVVLEGVWGRSAGKWLLNLRVCTSPGHEQPGWGRALVRFAVFCTLLSLEQVAMVATLVHLKGSSSEVRVYLRDVHLSNVSLAAELLGLLGIALLLCTMRRRNGWRGLHEFASGTCVVQLPETVRHRVPSSRFFGDDLSRPAGLPERVGPFEVRGALRWDDAARVLWGEDPALGRTLLLRLRPREEEPLGAARRACARTTRLRWLASGVEDVWQWDAFPAPDGQPLTDLVSADGPLHWPQTRLLLEQLTEELAAADGEGTLPQPLAVSAVWVRSDGGALLLDVPLRPEDAKSLANSPRSGALALLDGVAALALEGDRPRHSRHLCAVVPAHASRLLDRLHGVETPYRDLQEFRSDFEATRGLPTRVTSSQRTAQLVVQVSLLAIGLLWMLGFGSFADVPGLVALRETQKDGQRILQRLEASPQSDEGLRDRLRKMLDDDDRELQARLADTTWLNNRVYNRIEIVIDRARERQAANQTGADQEREDADSSDKPDTDADPHAAAKYWMEHHGEAKIDASVRKFALVGIAAWPALWVLSAFVFRGSLTYFLMGFSVVRGDGRRAGRFRCAWRALLVWGPPAALLAAAVLLDGWYWSAAAQAGRPWILRAAELMRWASFGLLVLFPVLAIRSPERTLHDRLAGTYLVPR